MSNEIDVSAFRTRRGRKRSAALDKLEGRSEVDTTEYRAIVAALEEEEKPTKFGNKPVWVDDIRFPSGHEADRYIELTRLEAAGEITNLERQKEYHLVVNGILICDYICDFRYRDRAGNLHVEDAKGYQTPKFRLQKKLMLAVHGIDVELV